MILTAHFIFQFNARFIQRSKFFTKPKRLKVNIERSSRSSSRQLSVLINTASSANVMNDV